MDYYNYYVMKEFIVSTACVLLAMMVLNGCATSQEKAAKKAEVIIQSAFGGEITPEAILAKVGAVDKVYVRVDENKAYWVRGGETGNVDLW